MLRDPIACKPAVMAETDDFVAMASEVPLLGGTPGHRRGALVGTRTGQSLHLGGVTRRDPPLRHTTSKPETCERSTSDCTISAKKQTARPLGEFSIRKALTPSPAD